jgi:hypothetical protein
MVQCSAPPVGGWPADLPGVDGLVGDGATALFATGDLNCALASIVAFLDGQGLPLVAVQSGAATLEDVIVGLSRP